MFILLFHIVTIHIQELVIFITFMAHTTFCSPHALIENCSTEYLVSSYTISDILRGFKTLCSQPDLHHCGWAVSGCLNSFSKPFVKTHAESKLCEHMCNHI